MFEKGFTLIELLAVIVVLAVIALIATPIVMNSISEARLESTRNSVYGILKSAEQAYAESILEDETLERNTNIIDQIDFKGQEPDSGQVIITNDGHARAALIFNDKCFLKIHDEVEIVEDLSECIVPEFVCGDTVYDERDNNTYQTVQIGEQCWFQENLRYVDNGCLDNEWSMEYPFDGCRINHSNIESDDNGEFLDWNQDEIIYQFDAALDSCPINFDLPSDSEIMILETYLGMDPSELNQSTGWRDSGNVGLKLRDSYLWNGPSEYNFNAIPTGFRGASTGENRLIGDYFGFWSKDDDGDTGWYRYIMGENVGVRRATTAKRSGISVRCLYQNN